MQDFIEAWRVSGKSKKEFCEEHQLGLPRFNYWLKKLQSELAGPGEFTPVGFFPANMADSGSGRARVELELPGGLIIRVY